MLTRGVSGLRIMDSGKNFQGYSVKNMTPPPNEQLNLIEPFVTFSIWHININYQQVNEESVEKN